MSRFDVLLIAVMVPLIVQARHLSLGSLLGIAVGGSLGAQGGRLFSATSPSGGQVLIALGSVALGCIVGALIGSRIQRLKYRGRWNSFAAGLVIVLGMMAMFVPLRSTPGPLGSILRSSGVVRAIGRLPEPEVLTMPATLFREFIAEYEAGGPKPDLNSTTTTTTVPVPFPVRPKAVSDENHRRIIDAVVRVSAVGCFQPHSATGVIVDGGILTNSHVLEGATEATIATWDGATYDVALRAYAAEDELALLTVPTELRSNALKVSNEKDVTTAYLYGYGDNTTLSGTRVTLKNTAEGPTPGTTDRRFEGTVRRGDSGAPLVTTNGEIIGLNWARERDQIGIGRARIATEIEEFLEERPQGDSLADCETEPTLEG